MTGFTFFQNYFDAINDEENGLTEEEQGRLYNAIFSYMFRDEEPNLKGACRMAFNLIKPSLDLSKARSNAKNKNQNTEEENQNGIKRNQSQIKTESNEIKTESNGIKSESSPFFEKEEERREKEEVEDIISSPSLCAGARDSGAELREFLEENGNISVDNCSTASLDLDYRELRKAFSVSSYLRERPHDLSWVAKNANRILRGDYKDNPARSGAPPNGDKQYEIIRRMYEEAKAFDEEAEREERNRN